MDCRRQEQQRELYRSLFVDPSFEAGQSWAAHSWHPAPGHENFGRWQLPRTTQLPPSELRNILWDAFLVRFKVLSAVKVQAHNSCSRPRGRTGHALRGAIQDVMLISLAAARRDQGSLLPLRRPLLRKGSPSQARRRVLGESSRQGLLYYWSFQRPLCSVQLVLGAPARDYPQWASPTAHALQLLPALRHR